MTKLYVNIDMKKAVRNGQNWSSSPCQIEVDLASLSQDHRDVLSRLVKHDPREAPSPYVALARREDGESYSSPTSIDGPTQDSLIRYLDQVRQAWSESKRLADQEQAEKLAKRQEKMAAIAAKPIDELLESRSSGRNIDGPYVYLTQWFFSVDSDLLSPETRAELYAERDRRDEAEIQAYRDRIAAAKADRDEWIQKHGSDQLKRLASEGIKHEKTYETERTAWEDKQFSETVAVSRPGWREVNPDQIDWNIADVGVRALALLDAARAIDPSCVLARLDGRFVAVAEFRGRTIVWPRD